jgi:hypothetical protein
MGNVAVKQAADGLGRVLVVIQPPARRVEVQLDNTGPTPVPIPSKELVNKSMLDEIEDLRRRMDAYVEAMKEQSRQPSKRGLTVTSGLLWQYVAFGVGGVGALLAGVFAVLKSVWKKAAMQIIPGVQAFTETAAPAVVKALKSSLFASTDEGTRDLITKTKSNPDVKALTDSIKATVTSSLNGKE